MRIEFTLGQQAAGQHAAQQAGEERGEDGHDREPCRDRDSEQQKEREEAAPTPRFEGERRRIPRLVAPCYEPADPGHGMTDETIDGVRISDDRFGRDGNEGEVGEHGRRAYHGTHDAETGRAWRRPERDRRRFPAAPEPWIDLSTGINSSPYPVTDLPVEIWSRLPAHDAELALLAAAAKRYGVGDPATIVAAPRHAGADPAPAAPDAEVARRDRRPHLRRA